MAKEELLEWFEVGREVRGWLKMRPDTTMFLITRKGAHYVLKGAVISDIRDGRIYADLAAARVGAEKYMIEWMLNVADPVLELIAAGGGGNAALFSG